MDSVIEAGASPGISHERQAVGVLSFGAQDAQKEVFASTEGKTTLDELDINQKIRLENALERINAEIKGGRVASEEQDVCWRERKSGSNLKVTRCGTQAERDQARQGARDWMEKPKVWVSPGCGS